MSNSGPSAKVLRDQAARDLITSALDRNVMVLAGAGAGKTHALVERMVAAVRTGAARVDRMAAITFTRKAAGEMRGRFLLRLRAEAGRVTGTEAERVREAVEKVDQCFIGTIHSFCGRILRERPIEAGLPPDFAELEGREEILLRRTAWNQFIQSRFAEDDRRLYELEDHGIYPEDLYSFFGRRCNYSDLKLKETTTPKPDLEPAVEEVRQFIGLVLPYIPQRPEKRDKLMEAIRRARHLLDNHGTSDDRDRAVLLKLFDGNLAITLKHWEEGRAFAREVKTELLPKLQAEVVHPALQLWRECAYRLVAEFVNDAILFYDRLRHGQGKVTFQDLLLRTATMLGESADVRTYFQDRFQTILVDEFQDTDPIQAEILMYLTGVDVLERDWRRCVPRPGSLFLVGDEKQSIYRFRRADVETFRHVMARIAETGGEVVQLNTSFRSLGNLCRWISESFPSIFESPAEPYQARFSPLYEYREDGADPHCVRKLTIPKVDKNLRRDILAIDAERISNTIAAALEGDHVLNERLLDEMASPGDFMILTRTATQLSIFARALESRGIPFDIVGGGRLGASRELADLVVLLETIYAPDNPLPFLAFLRGALVGLADDELYAFRKAGGRFHFRAPLPAGFEGPLRERIQSAVDLIKRAEEELATRPPASAIERILEFTGLLPFASVHPDGQASSRAGNLLRAMSLIRQHEARGRHWGEIVNDLRELIDDPAYDLEEMTLEAGREDVVRLMNLHQAKGLQAKVVFLADPYDRSPYGRQPDAHVSRSREQPYLSMIVRKPIGEWRAFDDLAQPAGWAEDCAEEERFQAGEEVRLLYVAATRAQDLLVVSKYDGNADGGPWHRLYDYLDEIPELQASPPPAPRAPAMTDVDWVRLRDELPGRRLAAARPSFEVRSVTGGRGDEEMEHAAREGRGRNYGVVIHQLFEDAVRGRIPDDATRYVHQVVRDAGLNGDRAADAIGALERFRNSAVWQEIAEAEDVFTEVPFGMRDESGVVRGVIDLVYRTRGRWKIVDYKTDAAATEAEEKQLRRKYDPQIQAYAHYWEGITGEGVESASLWFVHGSAPKPQLSLF